MTGDLTRFFAAATAAIPAVALLLLLSYVRTVRYLPRVHQTEINLVSHNHRRLLQVDEGTTSSGSTQRVGDQCSMDDIVVYQGATGPLPSGIPTYTVSVPNLCSVSGGCSIGNIHLRCAAFSSARLINPRIFRRLSINDCLLNDGRPLAPGSVVSFHYANSFSYRLVISNATCAKEQS